MTSTTTPARARRSEREVPIPFREVKDLVTETFPVPMAIHGTGGKGGGREFYPNIEGLRLKDGTERFRCTSVKGCQHTYTSYGKVRYHIGKEHPNPKKVAARARKAAAAVAAPAAELVLAESAPADAVEVRPEPAPPAEPAPGAAAPARVAADRSPEPEEQRLDSSVKLFTELAESRNQWRGRAEDAEKLLKVERERRERAEKNLGELHERLRKLAEV